MFVDLFWYLIVLYITCLRIRCSFLYFLCFIFMLVYLLSLLFVCCVFCVVGLRDLVGRIDVCCLVVALFDVYCLGCLFCMYGYVVLWFALLGG